MASKPAPFKRVDAPKQSGKPRVYVLDKPLVTRKTELISVTSILSALPKPAIAQWNANVVAETAVEQKEAWGALEHDEAIDWLKQAPFRQMSRRGKRGSDIHYVAESVLSGQAEVGDSPWAQHILEFAKEWIAEIIVLEQTVVHLAHGWGGTTDIVYRNHQGDIVMGDWKSSKDVYPDNAFQLAAYASADAWVMNADTAHPTLQGPLPIDRVAVLHVTENGVEYYEPQTDVEEMYDIFRALQRTWEALRGEDKVRLAKVPKPPRPTVEEYVAHLRARCMHAQSENPEFKTLVKAVWPEGIPTLASGDIVNIRQCEKIDKAVNECEKLLSISFGAVPHLGYSPGMRT